MVKATLEDLDNKLLKEKENYDKLLESKIELEEQLVRLQKTKAEDTEVVEEQDRQLAALKAEIEAEQAEVEALNDSVVAARKVKKVEEERNRRFLQQQTALLAKQAFIESNYDYTSAAQDMNVEIFKNVVRSNQEINDTVAGFVNKVDAVKKETNKILASRFTY